jgi:hypothetical protein
MGASLQTCKQATKHEWKHVSCPQCRKLRSVFSLTKLCWCSVIWMVRFSIIVRNMERASVMKNIMSGGGRNLNLLFAVNTLVYCLKVLYCSRTKLNLIQPMQPLKWIADFTLNFSFIHCTVQILLNFTITCSAHRRSITWLLIKMVYKVKILHKCLHKQPKTFLLGGTK